MNFKPAQLHGDVWLHGKIAVGIGPIGLGLTADATLEADIFRPFHILGIIDVGVDLPWPLPDFNIGIRAEWGPEPVPPPIPHPLKEVALEHPKASLVWPLTRGTLLRPTYEAEEFGPGMLASDDQGALDALGTGLDKAGPPRGCRSCPSTCGLVSPSAERSTTIVSTTSRPLARSAASPRTSTTTPASNASATRPRTRGRCSCATASRTLSSTAGTAPGGSR